MFIFENLYSPILQDSGVYADTSIASLQDIKVDLSHSQSQHHEKRTGDFQ